MSNSQNYSIFKIGNIHAGLLRCSLALILSLSVIQSETVFAQGIDELPGITIFSANRTETELAKVGSSVEVITKQDLEKSGQTYVVDYLRQVPGVSFAQSGGPGTITNVSIRGASANFIKVLVDGIDVSDNASFNTNVAFEHLLVSDISRIEIVKGSQSTLYGSQAVGGLISITTNRPLQPGTSQFATSEYGQFNTYKGAYSIGYSGEKGEVSFTVQGVTTDGFSAAEEDAGNTEDDGYENITFSSRGTMHLSEAVSVFYAVRAFNATTEFDDFGLTPIDDTIGNNTETRQRAGRVGMNISLLDGKFENTFAFQALENERETFQANFFGDPETSIFIGERIKAEYKGLAHLHQRFSLLFGVDWEENSADTQTAFSSLDAETDTLGGYIQGTLEPIDNLTLTLGGRIDDHSTFGTFETYRATAAYQIPQWDMKLRGSLGTGFRAPSLSELFDPNFGFNTDPNNAGKTLNPEESESWDVGVDKFFMNRKVKISATYFELDTDNLISFDSSTFRPINIDGVSERNGVELSARAQIIPQLALSASYTYIEAEAETGNRLVRVPKHTVVLGLDAKPTEKLSLNVWAKIVSDTVDSDFSSFPAQEAALDDYVLLNAKAEYSFDENLSAYIRGQNLLDDDYQTVLGYGTSDLAIYGGLKWNWQQADRRAEPLK